MDAAAEPMIMTTTSWPHCRHVHRGPGGLRPPGTPAGSARVGRVHHEQAALDVGHDHRGPGVDGGPREQRDRVPLLAAGEDRTRLVAVGDRLLSPPPSRRSCPTRRSTSPTPVSGLDSDPTWPLCASVTHYTAQPCSLRATRGDSGSGPDQAGSLPSRVRVTVAAVAADAATTPILGAHRPQDLADPRAAPRHDLLRPRGGSVLHGASVSPRRSGYFASRSAPMGAVAADTVVATFFNFLPRWSARRSPGPGRRHHRLAVLAARLAAADAALRRMLGDAVDSAEMARAAEPGPQSGRARRRTVRGPTPVRRATPASPGRTNRTSCSGTPRPCSASSGVTATSPTLLASRGHTGRSPRPARRLRRGARPLPAGHPGLVARRVDGGDREPLGTADG